MKVPRACRQCRASKRKCVGPAPGETCDPCRHRKLTCSSRLLSTLRVSSDLRPGPRSPLPPERDSHVANRRSQPLSVEQGLECFSRGISIELTEHYLERVHDRPHSLFHPATLRTQVREGTVGKGLLYAICAIGSKFSANPEVRRLEQNLTRASRRVLQLDLENCCLENIQSCVLICLLGVGNSEHVVTSIYFRIATTMADIIKLDRPEAQSGSDSTIVREVKRRVWWSLYMSDQWCFSGAGLRPQMREPENPHDLPMDEACFGGMLTKHTVESADVQQKGIWAHLITLVKISTPIEDLNRRVASTASSEPNSDRMVDELSHRLDAWRDSLPQTCQMTEQNLLLQQKRGLGGPFVVLHLGYNYFCTLLYFRFLEDQQQGSEKSKSYAALCKAHASAFSGLLRRSRQLKGCEILIPLIGHKATVSSSVLVHTLLFGDAEELPRVREELNANFEAMFELKQYWPAVSSMMDRLVSFQNACLLSMDTSQKTHKLDGWMVKFLTEHSLPLAEKNVATSAFEQISNNDVMERAREYRRLGRYTVMED